MKSVLNDQQQKSSSAKPNDMVACNEPAKKILPPPKPQPSAIKRPTPVSTSPVLNTSAIAKPVATVGASSNISKVNGAIKKKDSPKTATASSAPMPFATTSSTSKMQQSVVPGIAVTAAKQPALAKSSSTMLLSNPNNHANMSNNAGSYSTKHVNSSQNANTSKSTLHSINTATTNLNANTTKPITPSAATAGKSNHNLMQPPVVSSGLIANSKESTKKNLVTRATQKEMPITAEYLKKLASPELVALIGKDRLIKIASKMIGTTEKASDIKSFQDSQKPNTPMQAMHKSQEKKTAANLLPSPPPVVPLKQEVISSGKQQKQPAANDAGSSGLLPPPPLPQTKSQIQGQKSALLLPPPPIALPSTDSTKPLLLPPPVQTTNSLLPPPPSNTTAAVTAPLSAEAQKKSADSQLPFKPSDLLLQRQMLKKTVTRDSSAPVLPGSSANGSRPVTAGSQRSDSAFAMPKNDTDSRPSSSSSVTGGQINLEAILNARAALRKSAPVKISTQPPNPDLSDSSAPLRRQTYPAHIPSTVEESKTTKDGKLKRKYDPRVSKWFELLEKNTAPRFMIEVQMRKENINPKILLSPDSPLPTDESEWQIAKPS